MSRSLFGQLTRRFETPGERRTRREFLKLTAIASAGALAGCAAPGGFGSGTGRGRRVVIVGAGLAGLACGFELVLAGYKVTILEARERIGGRVVLVKDFVPGKRIEAGGEFIGANHPAWQAYARRFHLKLREVSDYAGYSDPIILNGQRLSNAEARALHDEMKTAYASMIRDAAPIKVDEPWASANAITLDNRSTANWLAGLKVSENCEAAIRSELGGNNGVALERQSYLGNLAQVKGGGMEDYWTQTETFRCEGGNMELAVRFAFTLGPERLQLGRPVSSIVAGDKSVMVLTSVGERFEADDLVLAVPPTIWPSIKFDPPLPAVLAPQMGHGLKYLAHLERRFWKDDLLSPDSITDGMISQTWDATDGQTPDRSVCLTCFSGGPAAELARKSWAALRDHGYESELSMLYPKYKANFVASRFIDWPGDQWTRGMYSFPAPGQITTQGPIMRQGLGRLHFAGEHTCYKFVGYMEGALNSGMTVARRLMATHGGTRNSERERVALA